MEVKQTNNIEEITNRFNKLDNNYKKEVLESLNSLILEKIDQQEKEKLQARCNRMGHSFSKWHHNKWITFKEIIIDYQIIDNYPDPHENWTRVCERCGYKEERKIIPLEIIKEKELVKSSKSNLDR